MAVTDEGNAQFVASAAGDGRGGKLKIRQVAVM